MIDKMLDIPSVGMLEKAAAFAERRQSIIANNIANIDTPGYQMKDLDVSAFQKHLRDALANPDGASQTETKIDYDQYMLFHDQNNRSIETQITEMTKNSTMHQTVIELLKSRYTLLEKAISLQA